MEASLVTAVGFLAAGLGLLFQQEWWRLTIIGNVIMLIATILIVLRV